MSFLKISDPLKRDAIVKEYLELKKKIRSNLLSERIGEQQLQTDLSKFYKPITETQKTTTREITEGLKPIREGIEKLPEAIQPIREGIEKLPEAIQPLGKATEEEEEEEEEEDESVGEIAISYLKIPEKKRDTTFGIYIKKNGDHYIGDTHVIIKDDDIIIKETGERFTGTHGLWRLVTSKNPNLNKMKWDKLDEENYVRLMEKTYVLHQGNNPNNPYAKSSGGKKWNNILTYIWHTNKFPEKEYEGSGVVVIPSDPNALLERLNLLLASQEAGHTGVRNELVSICDELKRQDILDTKAYKKLNHLIKNDSN